MSSSSWLAQVGKGTKFPTNAAYLILYDPKAIYNFACNIFGIINVNFSCQDLVNFADGPPRSLISASGLGELRIQNISIQLYFTFGQVHRPRPAIMATKHQCTAISCFRIAGFSTTSKHTSDYGDEGQLFRSTPSPRGVLNRYYVTPITCQICITMLAEIIMVSHSVHVHLPTGGKDSQFCKMSANNITAASLSSKRRKKVKLICGKCSK